MFIKFCVCHKPNQKYKRYFLHDLKVYNLQFYTFLKRYIIVLLDRQIMQVWIWKGTPFEYKKRTKRWGNMWKRFWADMYQNFQLFITFLKLSEYLGKEVVFLRHESDLVTVSAFLLCLTTQLVFDFLVGLFIKFFL